MQWFYRLIFLPVLVLACPYYLRRMFRRGGYSQDFGHRFGATASLPPKRPGVTRVWLQAVSVGELLAIEPLVNGLASSGSHEIYLTTTTSTGYRLAQEKYADRTAGIGYFPLDFWWFSARTWRRVRPDVVVLTEGELWPEHLYQARRHEVPVVLVNGRLSDRSYRRMTKARPLIRRVLERISMILASSADDGERFRNLGAESERVRVTGNIKVDFDPGPGLSDAERAGMRQELGLGTGNERILVGSSTWPGEEGVMVEALRAMRAAGISCRLLLVPRHAERRAEIEAELRSSGFSFHLRSSGNAKGEVDIAVGDTTGELRRLVQLGDLVFVGKSLPPHRQGQTPVEAAAFGRAILFGPGMTNFRAISRTLVVCGAAKSVTNAAELTESVVALMKDEASRAAMGEAGRRWQEGNRGAVATALETILELETAGR